MPCSSTPIANCPKTPSTPRWSSSLYNSKPSYPSPLAPSSSPDHISPIHQRQSRRRQQFKNPSPTPAYNPRSDPTFSQVRRRLFAPPPTTSTGRNTSNTNPFIHSPGSDDSPQKAFLRARFREKCFQRAKRAREKGVSAKRWGSELSSDGIDSEDVEMDGNNPDEGDDEFGLDDEIFRRVVTNENRRRDYAYRLSYELDVGSSIDPDMEDIAALEEELLNVPTNPSTSANPANMNANAQNQSVMLDGGDLPEDWDLDDEELAEMYEEYVREIEADQQQQQQQPIDANPSINTGSPVETADDMYWAMDDLMEG